MKTGTGKRIGHGQSLYYDTRSQLAVCINCLGPAQVRGAIDSVFGVTEVDELWPTITRSNRTRNDSHAAVSRFIIGKSTPYSGCCPLIKRGFHDPDRTPCTYICSNRSARSPQNVSRAHRDHQRGLLGSILRPSASSRQSACFGSD